MTTDIKTSGGRLPENQVALSVVSDAAMERERAQTDFIDAVLQAWQSGLSHRAIANAAGLSHTRIGNIIREYGTHY